MPVGPAGGDARSFTPDPTDHNHLYLGTADGWVYESHDCGETWVRLSQPGGRDDQMIDNIVVDRTNPRHLIAGVWVVDRSDGGIYTSQDGGHTWTVNSQMLGESIRALTDAPSDPKTLVAGALSGVFRSTDGGVNWQRISPLGSTDLHEIQSLAIDPRNPKIIYAGTWHLPWKTNDGGEHWYNIKQGIIDDSDVFSIIIDPNTPDVVYASACSGIYKSLNAGDSFVKVQGIPSTARRTRVLMQDPQHSEIVYAGTTEGLWRTSDAGFTWLNTTSVDIIVNDVYVDPTQTNHVLIATDRGGVLASSDGGFTFRASNSGFSARQVTAYVSDERNPAHVYVGVVNDKQAGGVFASDNGGLSWSQRSLGLEGRDVFALGEAPDGTLLAGTNHGIVRWSDIGWAPSSEIRDPNTHFQLPIEDADGSLNFAGFTGPVFAIECDGNTLYAATHDGVLLSRTAGNTWQWLPGTLNAEWRFISVHDGIIVLGGPRDLRISTDGGTTLHTVNWPGGLSQLSALAFDNRGQLWVGGREGLFFTGNRGITWHTVPNFPVSNISSLYFDAANSRILVTQGSSSTLLYSVGLDGVTTSWWDTGWHLRMARTVGDHFIGATLFDGMVLQPRMIVSPAKSLAAASKPPVSAAKPAVTPVMSTDSASTPVTTPVMPSVSVSKPMVSSQELVISPAKPQAQ
jgi:photosystem II stability/assembly factor-like uncharacterized protein